MEPRNDIMLQNRNLQGQLNNISKQYLDVFDDTKI